MKLKTKTLTNLAIKAIVEMVKTQVRKDTHCTASMKQLALYISSQVPRRMLQNEFNDWLDYEQAIDHHRMTSNEYLNYFTLAHFLGATRGYFALTPKTLVVLAQLSHLQYKEVFIILPPFSDHSDGFHDSHIHSIYKTFGNVKTFVSYLNDEIYFKYVPKYLKNLEHFDHFGNSADYFSETDLQSSIASLLGLKSTPRLVCDRDSIQSLSNTVVSKLKTVTIIYNTESISHLSLLLKICPTLQQVKVLEYFSPTSSTSTVLFNSLHLFENIEGMSQEIEDSTLLNDVQHWVGHPVQQSEASNVKEVHHRFQFPEKLPKYNITKLKTPPRMSSGAEKVLVHTCPNLKFIEVGLESTDRLDFLLEFNELAGLRLVNIPHFRILSFLKKKGKDLRGLSLIHHYSKKMPLTALYEILSLCPNLELFHLDSHCYFEDFSNAIEIPKPEGLMLNNLKYLSLTNIENNCLPKLDFLLESPKLEILEVTCALPMEDITFNEFLSHSCWSSIHTFSSRFIITERRKKVFLEICPLLKCFLQPKTIIDNRIGFDELILEEEWWDCNHFQSMKPQRFLVIPREPTNSCFLTSHFRRSRSG